MPDASQASKKKETTTNAGSQGDRCGFCLSREFKRSRLHAGDLFTLLRGRVPARCVKCGQLQTISLKAAKTALPAGAASETARAMTPAMTPAAFSDSGVRRAVVEPQVQTRAAIPQRVLQDDLDIRCQYCPGQMFRRSRLRARDLGLIVRMRYSARCLLCGQRQSVSFMVAGSAVPSSVKQARSVRNAESWKEFTSGSNPAVAPVVRQAPLAPVVGQVYALKDVEPEAPRTPLPAAYGVKESKPAPVAKKPSGDPSIW